VDAERVLVSRLVHSGEVETVISRGISEDHFADDECQKVFEFVIGHTKRYKTPPSMQVVKERFPKFEFEISQDSISYLIDNFITKVKRRLANEFLMELAEIADDPEKSSEIDIHFLDVSRQLATVVPSTEVARFSDMGRRIDQYHADKEKGTPWGIRLGIPALDDKTMGLQPHELCVVAGWQGVGKSTLLQFFGFNGYLQSKKVMIVSLEMEHRAILRKFDAMAAELTYRDLKRLELGDDAVERWRQYASEAENNREHQDIIIIDRIGSRTPMGIFSETVRHKPDLVIVDYISLLEAPRGAGEKSWQQIGHISRELKLNARTLGIPVIAAAQTNRDSVQQGVKLETIAFSSSIGMDADIVLGLNQDDDMRVEKEMEVVMVKNRDGAPGRVKMNWDMETMQFGERPQFMKHQPRLTPPPDNQPANPFKR
jgi:replicative DNA helicase